MLKDFMVPLGFVGCTSKAILGLFDHHDEYTYNTTNLYFITCALIE